MHIKLADTALGLARLSFVETKIEAKRGIKNPRKSFRIIFYQKNYKIFFENFEILFENLEMP